MPDSEVGVLQISSPRASISWRDADPEPLIRQFVEDGRLGQVVTVSQGELPYGRFVMAECIADDHGDVCCWLVLPETHDPLCITWIADSPGDAGAAARALVSELHHGFFSSAVAATIDGARSELMQTGTVQPVTLLFGDGTIVNIILPFDDDPLIVEGIRHERTRADALVVARVALAEIRKPDGTAVPIITVYVESETRQKRFVIPFETHAVHEIDGTPPIAGFFAPADPRIAALLERE